MYFVVLLEDQGLPEEVFEIKYKLYKAKLGVKYDTSVL